MSRATELMHETWDLRLLLPHFSGRTFHASRALCGSGGLEGQTLPSTLGPWGPVSPAGLASFSSVRVLGMVLLLVLQERVPFPS